MHQHLTFEGPEQSYGGKNCQNGSQGKPCPEVDYFILSQYTFILFGDYPVCQQVLFQELLL